MKSTSPMWPPRLSKLNGALVFGALMLAVLAAASIGGLGVSTAQTDTASVERGGDLARLLCTKCHTLSARGDSPNADAPPFRELLQKLTPEGIEDELAEGILMGHQPMPQWEFSSQQIYDLSNFIISLGERV